MEKFSDKSEKNKNRKKSVNDDTHTSTNNKSNKVENVYFSEYRDSNTSEISNCDDNNFFSQDNSPILMSSDYKKMEKVPLLEETSSNKKLIIAT